MGSNTLTPEVKYRWASSFYSSISGKTQSGPPLVIAPLFQLCLSDTAAGTKALQMLLLAIIKTINIHPNSWPWIEHLAGC